MKVIVKETTGTDVNLPLPSGLVFNPVSATILAGLCKKYGVAVSRKQMVDFLKLVREYKKNHPDWRFIEVDSPDGEHVEIVL